MRSERRFLECSWGVKVEVWGQTCEDTEHPETAPDSLEWHQGPPLVTPCPTVRTAVFLVLGGYLG